MTTDLTAITEAINALPSSVARADCAQHLRIFYGFPDIHPHDLPHALAAVASFGVVGGAESGGRAGTGIRPSESVPGAQGRTERPTGDAAVAGAATVALTANLADSCPDLAGPPLPAGITDDMLTTGASRRLTPAQMDRVNWAWEHEHDAIVRRINWLEHRTVRPVSPRAFTEADETLVGL